MKKQVIYSLLASFLLLNYAPISHANASCDGEALLTAGIAEVVKSDSQTCKISIDIKKVSYHRENSFCPLALEDILSTGISVVVDSTGNCPFSPAQIISGVVVRQIDGSLWLE